MAKIRFEFLRGIILYIYFDIMQRDVPRALGALRLKGRHAA